MRLLKSVVDRSKRDDRPALIAVCRCGSGAWLAMNIEASDKVALQCGSCHFMVDDAAAAIAQRPRFKRRDPIGDSWELAAETIESLFAPCGQWREFSESFEDIAAVVKPMRGWHRGLNDKRVDGWVRRALRELVRQGIIRRRVQAGASLWEHRDLLAKALIDGLVGFDTRCD